MILDNNNSFKNGSWRSYVSNFPFFGNDDLPYLNLFVKSVIIPNLSIEYIVSKFKGQQDLHPVESINQLHGTLNVVYTVSEDSKNYWMVREAMMKIASGESDNTEDLLKKTDIDSISVHLLDNQDRVTMIMEFMECKIKNVTALDLGYGSSSGDVTFTVELDYINEKITKRNPSLGFESITNDKLKNFYSKNTIGLGANQVLSVWNDKNGISDMIPVSGQTILFDGVVQFNDSSMKSNIDFYDYTNALIYISGSFGNGTLLTLQGQDSLLTLQYLDGQYVLTFESEHQGNITEFSTFKSVGSIVLHRENDQIFVYNSLGAKIIEATGIEESTPSAEMTVGGDGSSLAVRNIAFYNNLSDSEVQKITKYGTL